HVSAIRKAGMARILGVLTIAALALVAAGSIGAAASFTDATGDSGAAPDVTAVSVTNDVAGDITFKVTVANQSALAADGAVQLVIDSDDNEKTGDSDGFDYFFELDGDNTYVFEKWNG